MSEYSARFSTPRWIERGKTQSLSMPIWLNGAIQAPSSGSITILKADGSELVSSASVTITNQIATYSLSSSLIPITLTLEEGWIEQWSLVLNGVTYLFNRDASLVRTKLYPVVSDQDLMNRHSDLNTIQLNSNITSFQSYLDVAWDDILIRLMGDGKYPYLILSPWALKPLHEYLTLSLIFTDSLTLMSTTSGFDKLATVYDKKYEDAWKKLKFTYDLSEDGIPDKTEQNKTSSPVVFLGGSPTGNIYSARRH